MLSEDQSITSTCAKRNRHGRVIMGMAEIVAENDSLRMKISDVENYKQKLRDAEQGLVLRDPVLLEETKLDEMVAIKHLDLNSEHKHYHKKMEKEVCIISIKTQLTVG